MSSFIPTHIRYYNMTDRIVFFSKILVRMLSFAVFLFVFPFFAGAQSDAMDDEAWIDIRERLYGGKEIRSGDGVISMTAPKRALNGSYVPIKFWTADPKNGKDRVRRVHIVLDMNPVPIAAVFDFSPETDWIDITVPMRIEQYTHVRVIAETDDGKLYMTKKFVKASGGCTAELIDTDKQPTSDKMTLKILDSGEHEKYGKAQLDINHPNSSGLQFNQLTRLFIPPDYIRTIEIFAQGKPLFTLESSIALSQNPRIEFLFPNHKKKSFEVKWVDLVGAVYSETWTL